MPVEAKISLSQRSHIERIGAVTLWTDPQLLPHYAVLGGATLLTLTVAHVQILTRLLASTCPAFYWYCAVHVFAPNSKWGDVILGYFLLYIVLGAALHSNFLPWT